MANPIAPSAPGATAAGLQACGIDVAFAGLRALNAVDLRVPPATIVGLIGPNGAGKTTMVNILTGFQAPSDGEVRLDGKSLAGVSAVDFRRRGIARTFQGGRLFRDLGVLDNLEVTGIGLGLSRRVARVEASQVLEAMGLGALAAQQAGALPYTDERRIAIARAIVGRPRYLLLDEPAAGMSEHEAGELSELIARLVRELGCGVLLIEHNVRMVLDTCSHIVVLDSGQVIESGDPRTVSQSERVRHAYMGTTADVHGGVESVEREREVAA
ncbi:ATP-binding cassette domain-containing protein [Variovorax ureilyticus]|uniref:ATP-binding cassette domain-containing protein n=1 Tax=Variovorax ureilyticus TaxID=1836198 RepID=A0ABU8VK57_9BURK